MALPKTTIFGFTPKCSMAQNFPVRKNPIWISSSTSRIFRSSRIFLSREKYPGGGMMYPPVACTGST